MAETVWLANPRGFCAGVERAIEIVEQLLAHQGLPIYVKHEVVHNKRVIDKLTSKGVVFVEDPRDVPLGATLVFSAHGVSQAVRKAAAEQALVVHDATCPLVTKVHAQVMRMHAAGKEIYMIGHRGHPEVVGTMGQVATCIQLVENVADARTVTPRNDAKLAYVTQTTLSVTETQDIIAVLRERFPAITGPAKENICYATQNRQDAVKAMATACDLLLVIGSRNSSNSNRLCEVAHDCGTRAYLIDGVEDIQAQWLQDCLQVGITAGASAPEEIVQEVVASLSAKFPDVAIKELAGVTEDIRFSVPKNLLTGTASSSKP